MNPRLARVLVVTAAAVAGLAACSGGGDVVVDQPRGDELAGADGGSETIEGPGFEVELEPGQNPDEVLTRGGEPEPTPPPAPENALATVCPALEAVLGGTATDDDRSTLRAATPEQWAADLGDVSDPAALVSLPPASAIDRFFYESCSMPLVQGAALVARGCDDLACRTARIEELGGLCFDDQGDGSNPYRLLSCVSGLPA